MSLAASAESLFPTATSSICAVVTPPGNTTSSGYPGAMPAIACWKQVGEIATL
ncbi:hypothetical protein [Microvirga sp. KLBC 81]|uniref:hypothetical protein n=1 Tax=Microvirga sp. KLBC 81 TaxID=1862707 RepID=UPI0014036351|nr:hypothetical protein [Microvirga sp. KLBC 81]